MLCGDRSRSWRTEARVEGLADSGRDGAVSTVGGCTRCGGAGRPERYWVGFDLGVGGLTGAREEFQTWVCRSGWGVVLFLNGGPGLGKIARVVLGLLSLWDDHRKRQSAPPLWCGSPPTLTVLPQDILQGLLYKVFSPILKMWRRTWFFPSYWWEDWGSGFNIPLAFSTWNPGPLNPSWGFSRLYCFTAGHRGIGEGCTTGWAEVKKLLGDPVSFGENVDSRGGFHEFPFINQSALPGQSLYA